jgi:hypothetical protein
MAKKKITGDELGDRAKENGYQRGAHRDEDSLRDQNKHVEVPDLATLKDFFRFVAASSKGMIVEKSTPKSLNTSGKWFFAGFSCVTGTPTDADDGLAKIQCLGP